MATCTVFSSALTSLSPEFAERENLPETTPNATFCVATKVIVFRRKRGKSAIIPADASLGDQDKSRLAAHPIGRNVVQIAREFDRHLMRPGTKGYKQVAEQIGVTKARVSHYLAILHRLPQEFVEWLEDCFDPVVLAYFTERRLRPVTRLPRSEQVRWLRQAAGELDGAGSRVDELLDILRDDSGSS